MNGTPSHSGSAWLTYRGVVGAASPPPNDHARLKNSSREFVTGRHAAGEAGSSIPLANDRHDWYICYTTAHPAMVRSSKLTLGHWLVASFLIGLCIRLINVQTDERRLREEAYQKTLSYESQLRQLQRVEISLRDLTQFVQIQRSRLRESQDLLQRLQREHESIRPMVEAERNAVDAVLRLQEERNRQNVRSERWIGFAMGVISSIVASIFFTFASRFVQRAIRPHPNEPPHSE